MNLRELPRRRLWQIAIATLAFALPTSRRHRAGAAPAGREGFTPLRESVSIPLAELETPWQPFSFVAWAFRSSDGEVQLRRLQGKAFRLPGPETRLTVLSVTCPHEICDVELALDPRSVPAESATPLPDHPLLVCPCHFSVFDPARDGRELAGPAHRGLYRFEHHLDGDRLSIVAIESAALR